MKLEILGRNYEVGEKLEQVTQQKLAKLDKYFADDNAKAKVVCKKQGNGFTTEIMLDYANKFVRASATSDNFYDNLDVILPKLEGQIRKHRTRFDKHQKNNAYKEAFEFGESKEVQQKNSSIVKEKTFKLAPMTVEEAIEEMELLGHNFYVFKEAKSGMVQVLYLRNDGDLGLIEPII